MVQRALTARAVIVGLMVVVGLSLATPYVGLMMRSQLLATNYYPVGLGVGFLAVVLVLNTALKTLRRAWGLTEGELAIVFVMAAVAITMPTHGTAGYLLSYICAPRYLATPENRWAEYFYPYLPRWAVVDGGEPLRWFFEGLPHGESIPWGVWLVPLVWWLAFVGVGLFACLCVISILRRQWMEHERLAYPLAEMTMELVRGAEDESRLPRFARSRLFWVGFLLPFVPLAWNTLSYFWPTLPQFPRELPPISLGKGFPPIFLVFYWPLLCIAFFLKLEVAFSIWVFVVLGVVQEGLFNRFGFRIRNALSVYHFDASRPTLAWQSYGAMVVMVGLNLWVARRHLAAVWRKALRPRDEALDDSNELMSSRVAVVGLVVAAVFMAAWLMRLGMQPLTAVVFLGAAMVGFIGLSRLVVEGGLVFIRPPLTPQSATVTVLGNAAMGATQLTAMGLSMAWVSDPINAFMPAAANAAKVGHAARARGRGVAFAMVLAAIVALAVTIPFTLSLCYERGAYTTGTWLFKYAPRVPYDYIVKAIGSEPGVEWAKLLWGGIGGVAMLGLTVLHHSVAWWPLHPLGLVAGVVFKVRWAFLPIFVGWLAKTLILRIGGAAALGKAKPFFIGTMAGWFAGAGLSVAVDWLFFFGDGHVIYWH